MATTRWEQYLTALTRPFRKLARLEFLQPDNSVAFALDNTHNERYGEKYDSRAFIQSGSLNVSLQNGTRRTATVELSNLDGAFDYAVNKVWFGRRVRLSMGLVLPDGSNFYLPQGVFYIKDPQNTVMPNRNTATYHLVDKWSYLDGSLFGRLQSSYQVNAGTNIFYAIEQILNKSKYTLNATAEKSEMIDSDHPVFTDYYNGRTVAWRDSSGTTHSAPMTDTPYTVLIDSFNGTIADLVLELNKMLAGWIGYDATGVLRLEASQDDLSDTSKPILWAFNPGNSDFLGLTETAKNAEVYNDIIISGEGLDTNPVPMARAKNEDPASDTNTGLIGLKTYRDSAAGYYTDTQCAALAEFQLKRRTVLKKTVAIEAAQIFHLTENKLVTVKRPDKEHAPLERHLIQAFSLPLSETGKMTITATSVSDFPAATVTLGAQ